MLGGAVGAESTAASRLGSGALPSAAAAQAPAVHSCRRVTAEQAMQQRLSESTHLGWLKQGDSFGEAALVSATKQRAVSVVAGDGGVMLLVMDRSSFNRLQQQAQQEKQPLAAAAVQAVLAAACRPILDCKGRRSPEDVDTLSELFSGLEVHACHNGRSRGLGGLALCTQSVISRVGSVLAV